MSKLSNKIVEVAKSYRGQEEEKGNSGFKSSWFLKLMIAVGWQKFQSWCAYAAKSVWLSAFAEFDPEGLKLVKKYANGSCVQSYKNFKASPEFKVRLTPVVGALVYFVHGDPKTSTTGHAGVVTWVAADSNTYEFDSGNTNKAGSREGTTFLTKKELTVKPYSSTSLNLLGFVYPVRYGRENEA